MPRYIKWDEVQARYASLATIGGADEVNSASLVYAEAEIDSRLGQKFTLPFSNNNLTIKDLCIDLTYIKAANITIEERQILIDDLNMRVDDLLMGKSVMVVSSGVSIATIGDTVFSSTMNDQPIFDLGHTLDMVVSSQYLDGLENDKL